MLGMGWFATEPGGLNRYFADLQVALSHRAPVHAFVVAEGGVLAEGVTGAASPATTLPLRLARLRRELGQARPVDVVNSHFALYATVLRTLPALKRLPRVVNFQGPWASESRVEGQGGGAAFRGRRAIERSEYRRADEFIVLSSTFRDELTSGYGVLPSRVHVVRPGVDLDRFSPRRAERARERLSLPASPVVLAVRRLAARMGLDVLLEAWARLDRGLLLLAGSGHERERLEALAQRLGLGEDRVRFLGRQPDGVLADLYAAVDLTVVPSLALEGFGLIVLESLASGTPVIASDTGGMAEVLPDLQDDLLVPPGDVDGLAARLRRAINRAGQPSEPRGVPGLR